MRNLRAIVIPAAVFPSVIFGGAYGTGREIAEFVSQYGAMGGLLACLIIAAGFSTIIFLCFEFARRFKLSDYRLFFKALIGRAWIAFEMLFLIAVLLVLAVNGSAAGTILADQFGINESAGVAMLFIVVVLLNFFGRTLIEQTMAVCMAALCVLLMVVCIQTVLAYGDEVAAAFSTDSVRPGWAVSGFQYVLYNVAVVPVLLYCARDLGSTRETLASSILAGIAGTFPAAVFHITFLADYPAILEASLPVYTLFANVAGPLVFLAYIIVLFSMMIQTVAGLLHGVNERLDGWLREIRGEGLTARMHALVAATILLLSLLLARFGIVALIAKGYGTLAWGYLLVFVLPLVTIGVYKLWFATSPVRTEP